MNPRKIENAANRFYKWLEQNPNINYDCSNFRYTGAHKKSKIRCLRCSKVKMITPVNIRNGKGCRECKLKETMKRKKAQKYQEYILAGIQRHGNKFDYTQLNYEGANKDVIIICKKHNHRFSTRINNHFRNDSGGCTRCKAEKLASIKIIHGKHGSRLYNIWSNMKQRCLNSKNHAFKNYGGRGIDIHQEWIPSFNNFVEWAMGNGYSEELELDRIDNNKGYSPENCRWVSPKQNSRNKRTNKIVFFNGIEMTLKQASEEAGQDYKLAYKRITAYSWDPERALTTPKLSKGRNKKYRLLEGLWSNVKGRCNNPNNKDYVYYGEKGIKMSSEWENNYQAFEEWCLGNGYKKGMQLDRVDNSKGYSAKNCRFVTPTKNARNKSNNNTITYQGKSKTTAEWAEQTGLKRETIQIRKRSGWTPEEIILVPLGMRRQIWHQQKNK